MSDFQNERAQRIGEKVNRGYQKAALEGEGPLKKFIAEQNKLKLREEKDFKLKQDLYQMHDEDADV